MKKLLFLVFVAAGLIFSACPSDKGHDKHEHKAGESHENHGTAADTMHKSEHKHVPGDTTHKH